MKTPLAINDVLVKSLKFPPPSRGRVRVGVISCCISGCNFPLPLIPSRKGRGKCTFDEFIINGLTVNGGQPIREHPFFAWPHYEEDEVAAAMLVLQSGRVNYWTGQEGRKFEEEYAASVGAKYAIALMNGSVALEAGSSLFLGATTV